MITVASRILRIAPDAWRIEGDEGNVLVVQPSPSKPGRYMIDTVAPDGTLHPLGTHAGAETAVLFACDVAEHRLFLSERLTPELLDGTIRLVFDDETESLPSEDASGHRYDP